MEYPDKIMRKTTLVKDFGFSEEYLMRIFRTKGQTIAWKISPKRNSPILFDTEGLEKWRKTGK